MSKVFFALFFFSIVLNLPLASGELPPGYDPSRGLEFFRKVLEEQSPQYLLLEGDLFEKGETKGEGDYFPYKPANILTDIRYIPRLPLPLELFRKEKQMIWKYLGRQKSFTSSLFIQTAFDHPGKQNFMLKRREAVPLEGRLLRASLWVHSHNYPHRLVLLFQRARGDFLSVPVGELFFKGWRRFDLNLAHKEFGAGKRKNRRDHRHKFLGFRILSAPHAQPGPIALLIDNLLFLSDRRRTDYPGSEIEDSWPN